MTSPDPQTLRAEVVEEPYGATPSAEIDAEAGVIRFHIPRGPAPRPLGEACRSCRPELIAWARQTDPRPTGIEQIIGELDAAETTLRAERLERPEADVIDRIDALVDEQMALGERWATGEDRCPVCGGNWHGLPGTGPATYTVNGHPGAEGYEQIGNGGLPGCPGAYAISAARIRWRYRLVDPPGWFQPVTRRPDWRTRWGGRPPAAIIRGGREQWAPPRVRFWDADMREITTPYVDQVTGVRYSTEHRCRADANGRCVWANCPRDSAYQDVILAQQQMTLGCPQPTTELVTPPPAQQIPRTDLGPRERLAAVLAHIQGMLWQIMGVDPPPDLDLEHRGHALIDRSGVFNPDGTISDEILAAQGFEELGRIAEGQDLEIVGPCEITRDGHTVTANISIRQHIPANWAILTGQVPILPSLDPPGTPPSTCSLCGRPADGHGHGGSGPGGGYTLDDLHRWRADLWESRGSGGGYRCCQCQRHLTNSTALLGTRPDTYWCRDCADNFTQAHHRQPHILGQP